MKDRYFNIPLEDVAGLLPFNKSETDDLSDEISEKKKIREEMGKFMDLLKKNMNTTVFYMGSEGNKERFLLTNGLVEIIVDRPLVINAHFTKLSQAKKYSKALKATLRKIVPESKIKKMLIDSVEIKDKSSLTIDKWQQMHNAYLKKSVTFTVAAVSIVVLFEVIKAASELIFLDWLEIASHNLIVVIGAVIVAFLFEPIKKRTEKMFNRHFVK